jgi:hypothetical protein
VRWVVVGAFAGMLLWAGGLTLGARTFLALKQKGGREPEALLAMATAEIGPGASNVYLGAWEIYYAGRALGWKLYKRASIDWNDPEMQATLSRMDHVIFRFDNPDRPQDAFMASLGFRARIAAATGVQDSPAVTGIWRPIRYTSYIIYSKERQN